MPRPDPPRAADPREPFNRAANSESAAPRPKPRDPDELHLRYNPPQLLPGGFSAPMIEDVAREELDGPAREAISEAQERMLRGESERGDAISYHDLARDGWTEQDIRDVEAEDRDRGLDLSCEWTDQVQYEYDRWALDTLQARYDERWGEREAIEQAEAFQERILDRGETRDNRDHGIEH